MKRAADVAPRGVPRVQRRRQTRPAAAAATLLAVVLCTSPALPADSPSSADLGAGLLDASPDARAAATKRIGESDIVTAAADMPVLVEALDDDAPAVQSAARDAIRSLAARAAPVLAKDLGDASTADGDGDVVDVIEGLGAALTPTDLAVFLVHTGEKGRLNAWIAVATARVGVHDDRPSKATIAVAAAETARIRGAEAQTAAAAVALRAHCISAMRESGSDAAVEPVVAPGVSATVRTLLVATKGTPSWRRAVVVSRFIVATGIGDAGVVEALVGVRAAPPVPASASADGGPSESAGGMPVDPRRSVIRAANAALARVSARVPEAAAALESLPASEFTSSTRFGSASGWGIAHAGGARFLAKKVADADAAERLSIAAAAADGGDRSPELIAFLKDAVASAASQRSPDAWSTREALDALGAVGPAASAAVPALEALFAATRLKDPHLRRSVAAALIRVVPGHAPAQAALLEEIAGGGPAYAGVTRTPLSIAMARAEAISALADGGAGLEAVDVLVAALSDDAPAGPRDADRILRRIIVLRGLGRLAADATPETATALGAVLALKARGDPATESLQAVLDAGVDGFAPYWTHAAVLDALGRLGAKAVGERDRIRALLSSPDARLRYRAALALRRIGAASKPPK